MFTAVCAGGAPDVAVEAVDRVREVESAAVGPESAARARQVRLRAVPPLPVLLSRHVVSTPMPSDTSTDSGTGTDAGTQE